MTAIRCSSRLNSMGRLLGGGGLVCDVAAQVFGEPAVAFRAEKPGLFQFPPTRFPKAWFHQNPLADPRLGNLLADSGDIPAGVDSLNARKADRRAGPACVVLAAVRF